MLVEVHPDVAQVLATTDHAYLEDMEKRLQKRIIVKARGSFALEDFELRSPGQKTPLDGSAMRSAMAIARIGGGAARKKLGPPAEVEAMLEEEERSSTANREEVQEDRMPEPRGEERAGKRGGVDGDAAAGGSAPDSTDRRPQAGTVELSARAESPQVAPEGDLPAELGLLKPRRARTRTTRVSLVPTSPSHRAERTHVC